MMRKVEKRLAELELVVSSLVEENQKVLQVLESLAAPAMETRVIEACTSAEFQAAISTLEKKGFTLAEHEVKLGDFFASYHGLMTRQRKARQHRAPQESTSRDLRPFA